MLNAKTKKKLWSDEDAMTLFKMARDGARIEDIYARFPDRPRNGINNKLHRQGFSTAKRN